MKRRAKKYAKGAFQLMSGMALSSTARRIHRYYDAAVGYMEGFSDNYVIKKVSAGKKIIFVHVNYKTSGLDPMLDKKLFKAADAVAVVSESCAESAKSIFPKYADKIHVVPNPVSPQLIQQLSEEQIPEDGFAPYGCFNIVTAARLENAHKAIDRAVLTLKRLEGKTPEPIRWYVFGDGSDKEKIKALIRQNGLEHSFLLMGTRKNVYPYIKKADLFVLPSRYEGKPLCITEAQILGCVPVVTEYISAREQIQSGTDGIVCPNSDGDELAEAILKLINDEQYLEKLRNGLSQRDYSVGADVFRSLIGI